MFGEKGSFKLYAELQLIIVKRNRVIMKYIRSRDKSPIQTQKGMSYINKEQ